jgi:hypothetical protein
VGAKGGDERLVEEGGEMTRGMGEEWDTLCRGEVGVASGKGSGGKGSGST